MNPSNPTAGGASPRAPERKHQRAGVTMREGVARLRVVVAPCRKCGAASIVGSIYCEPCEEEIIGGAVRNFANGIRNAASRPSHPHNFIP